MSILDIAGRIAPGRNNAVYRCWMCGAADNDAVAFLWHINTCGTGTAGKLVLLKD